MNWMRVELEKAVQANRAREVREVKERKMEPTEEIRKRALKWLDDSLAGEIGSDAEIESLAAEFASIAEQARREGYEEAREQAIEVAHPCARCGHSSCNGKRQAQVAIRAMKPWRRG